MLQVTALSKAFGARDLFSGVTFHVGARDRVGLVAANGTGKTTLLRIIAGAGTADAGTVALQKGVITGYLSQESAGTPGNTVRRELLSGLGDLVAVQAELDAVNAQLHGMAPGDPRLDELVGLQGLLQHRFEDLRGYDIETELGRVLRGLGFSPGDAERPVETFSGGWQMRIALGRLLLQRPDLLLLDEPTNHLDMFAVEWLEGYLSGYPGALLMVSHDRRILDTITTRTLELAGGVVQEYAGNYSAYVAEKARRAAAQAEAFERQQRHIADTQAWIDRFHAKATKASQARSRQRSLEKLELVPAPEAAARAMALRFDTAGRSGRTVLELAGVTRRFGPLTVLDGIDLTIERGERLALVGPNGAGKSTLMRLLAGVDEPDAGLVRRGENAQPAYFAQHQAETLDPENTVLEELGDGGRMGEGELRSLLGRFLFSGDDAFKRVGVLSGGERSRLAFAKMLRRATNLLLLDEPTNHLDIQSQEVLERALMEYPGAIVLASHDRYLIDRLAGKIAVVENGGIQVHLGNYSQYRARLDQREAFATGPVAGPAAAEKRAPSPARQRADAAAARRRLAAVEAEIAALEAEQTVLAGQLNDPDLYADHQQAQAAVARHQAVGTRLDALLVEWEEASAAVG